MSHPANSAITRFRSRATITGLALATAGLVSLACAQTLQPETHNQLTEAEREAGWELLFDGENPAEHWRGYNRDELPSGWQAIDGWLTLENPGAGDIITHETYESFELFTEWKVRDRSNSGIFYMAAEIPGQPIWASAPEYQIIDNNRINNALHGAGALYDIIAHDIDFMRPVGEVNTARIVVDGSQITHYMNGRKLLSVDMDSDWWAQTVEASKFNSDIFAQTRDGHIGLQDHGDWVAYRNIMIRRLD